MDRASGSLRALIIQAHDQGMTGYRIAKVARVSREWVSQVLKGER